MTPTQPGIVPGFTSQARSHVVYSNVVDRYGAEKLRKVIDAHFRTLISIIEKNGGDIIRVAGDAVIAMWAEDAETKEDSELGTQTAAACDAALACVAALESLTVLDEHFPLHCGIACGDLTAYIVGGGGFRGSLSSPDAAVLGDDPVETDWAFTVCGTPLDELGNALDRANAGEVAVTGGAWEALNDSASAASARGWHGTPLVDGSGVVRLLEPADDEPGHQTESTGGAGKLEAWVAERAGMSARHAEREVTKYGVGQQSSIV